MMRDESRECTVCVKSAQTDGTGEIQRMETRSRGRLSEREGVLYVLYEESAGEKECPPQGEQNAGRKPLREAQGLAAGDKPLSGRKKAVTRNLLKIECDPLRASLKKSGEISWKMCFEAGKRDCSEYRTPYGALSIGASTEKITLKRQDKKTSLQLAYTLFIQGEKQADCRLEIEIL